MKRTLAILVQLAELVVLLNIASAQQDLEQVMPIIASPTFFYVPEISEDYSLVHLHSIASYTLEELQKRDKFTPKKAKDYFVGKVQSHSSDHRNEKAEEYIDPKDQKELQVEQEKIKLYNELKQAIQNKKSTSSRSQDIPYLKLALVVSLAVAIVCLLVHRANRKVRLPKVDDEKGSIMNTQEEEITPNRQNNPVNSLDSDSDSD